MNAHTENRLDSYPPWYRLRVAIFFVVLCVPLAALLIPFPRTWTESRKPVFPDWSWKVDDIWRYPRLFEEQFNAALPWRVRVATPSRRFYVDWLGTSPIAEAIVGTDSWLYYTGLSSEKLLDRNVRGRDPFSQDELERWRRLLLERTRHFAGIGARYVLVIAPNKESIYPEHLPAWIGPRVGPSRLDQLMAFLKSTPEVTAIDLRPSLIAEKESAMLYYKADTHWNTRGAYIAYREVMRILEPDFPGIPARTWASFNPRVIAGNHHEIANMIGLGGTIPDTDFKLDLRACPASPPDPISIPVALQPRLAAPAYATRCGAPGKIDAVIFHDSFGWALAPFLAQSFRSTVNFSATQGSDTTGYDLPEKLKANLVVEIIVERSLSPVPDIGINQPAWQNAGTALASAGNVAVKEIGFGGIYMLHALSINRIRKTVTIEAWWEELRHEEANDQRYLFLHVIDATGKILDNRQIALFPYQPSHDNRRWRYASVKFESVNPDAESLAFGIYQPNNVFLKADKGRTDWDGRRVLVPLVALPDGPASTAPASQR